jgi:hypothetical protein
MRSASATSGKSPSAVPSDKSKGKRSSLAERVARLQDACEEALHLRPRGREVGHDDSDARRAGRARGASAPNAPRRGSRRAHPRTARADCASVRRALDAASVESCAAERCEEIPQLAGNDVEAVEHQSSGKRMPAWPR